MLDCQRDVFHIPWEGSGNLPRFFLESQMRAIVRRIDA
jgi:hypothetical protein